MPRSKERIAVLICSLGAMAESLIYTSLAPLLAALDNQLGLAHAHTGLIVGAYAIGSIAGVFPAFRLESAIGARAMTAIGMAIVAASSLGFAHVGGYHGLLATRLLAGFGGTLVYSGLIAVAGQVAGKEGRGLAVGTVFSGYAIGSAIGPFVGSFAVTVGREPVFTVMAIAQLLIALLLTRLPEVPRPEFPSLRNRRWFVGSNRVRVGLWITALPGFAVGVLTVSGAHRLDDMGAGHLMVAIAFSGMAVIDIFVYPWVGRVSDTMGRRKPLTVALLVATIAIALIAAPSFAIVTVILIAVAGAAIQAVDGPGLGIVGDGIAEQGGDREERIFLSNLLWGPSAALGAIGAGFVHGSLGVEIALAVLAAITAVSLVMARRVAR